MPSRRQNSTKLVHAIAHDAPSPPNQPKTLELEQRVSRLEFQVKELIEALALERQKNASLQAGLDYCLAKSGCRF